MWTHKTLKVEMHEERLLATSLLLRKLAEDGSLIFRDENGMQYQLVETGYPGSTLGVGIRRLVETDQLELHIWRGLANGNNT